MKKFLGFFIFNCSYVLSQTSPPRIEALLLKQQISDPEFHYILLPSRTEASETSKSENCHWRLILVIDCCAVSSAGFGLSVRVCCFVTVSYQIFERENVESKCVRFQ
jgi:hypothetical protein